MKKLVDLIDIITDYLKDSSHVKEITIDTEITKIKIDNPNFRKNDEDSKSTSKIDITKFNS